MYYNVNNARKLVFPDVKFKREGNSTKHQVWGLVKDMEPKLIGSIVLTKKRLESLWTLTMIWLMLTLWVWHMWFLKKIKKSNFIC